MNLKKITFGMIVFTIAVLGVFGVPQTSADDTCNNSLMSHTTQYVNIEPLGHSITGGGNLVALCGSQSYYWFDVFLETDSAGELTIEIPKKSLDLPQFDYFDCKDTGYFYVYGQDDKDTLVLDGKQIARTDTLRIIKLTWDSPVQQISYFGGAGLIPIDETTYSIGLSQPRHCILQYENNNYDPKKPIPLSKQLTNELNELLCSQQHGYSLVHLNYTITNGSIEKVCINSYGHNLNFMLDVEKDGYLILDIPHDLFRPNPFSVQTNHVDSYKVTSIENRDFIGDSRIGGSYTFDPSYNGGNQSLAVTVFDFDDDSVEYKIPFLKDDLVFELSQSAPAKENPPIPKHILEKYSEPLINNVSVLHDDKKSSCKSNFVSIMKHDYSKSACVTPATAEKLIKRGWAI